jgi:hypothetical protein
LVYLPSSAVSTIQSWLKAQCNAGVQLEGLCDASAKESIFEGYCYTMTSDQLALYPNISFSLNGISWPIVMTPTQYFYVFEDIYYCFGIGSASKLL